MISEIEDLKLEIFQKDQRIKFRDNQITNLIEEKNNLKKEYENSLGNFSEFENTASQNNSQYKEEIQILKNEVKDLNLIIKKYQDEINILKQTVENSISKDELQNLSIDNSILKNEIKLIKQKNIELQKNIDSLNSIIKEKQKQINELIHLKDQQHHG